MFSIITDLPNTVVGVKATGTVDKDDFEKVLIPALQELSDRTGKINYLLLLETDISNFTFGAWIDDAKMGLKHLTKWHRVAIVTDQKGVEKFSNIFSFVVPGEYKGYPLSELTIAKKWVSEQ